MSIESIVVHPSDVLLKKDTGLCKLRVKNTGDLDYGFKIKSTHPACYSVRPSTGILLKYDEIEIVIRQNRGKDQDMQHHKFLLQFAPATKELIRENLQELFNLPGIEKVEKRLSVLYSSDADVSAGEEAGEKQSLVFFVASLFVAYYTSMLLKKILFGV
ncbi:hypothetical protein NEDG_00204 [Nematocida displodere]|uniref:MSP domain-containing protein n=1 Tax=Nematocida displodere TaxID=1805483 RepID=A0A177EL72_9MICR|nr:hypothetical protein NEDG_00204 [Nematocida displodere]